MEHQTGTLKVWKDEKGFGFIQPEIGGKDVFVHIRDFGHISRKPRVGDSIQYQPMKDREGRLRAGDVQIQGVARGAAKPNTLRHRRHNPSPRKTGTNRLAVFLPIALVCILGFVGYNTFQNNSEYLPLSSSQDSASDALIQQAFQNRQSNLQVTGSGVVVRMLPDDLEGSRHQKFILRLASGQTLLMSHNIDLASRIASLSEGDRITFNGEYEWNSKGGVVHWTHRDPVGNHENGWIKHEGRMYQ